MLSRRGLCFNRPRVLCSVQPSTLCDRHLRGQSFDVSAERGPVRTLGLGPRFPGRVTSSSGHVEESEKVCSEETGCFCKYHLVFRL